MYDISKDYMIKKIDAELKGMCFEPVTDYEEGYIDALNWMLELLDKMDKDG